MCIRLTSLFDRSPTREYIVHDSFNNYAKTHYYYYYCRCYCFVDKWSKSINLQPHLEVDNILEVLNPYNRTSSTY